MAPKTPDPAEQAAAGGPDIRVENGVTVIRAASGTAGPTILKVPAAPGTGLLADADPHFLEAGPYGPLPRLGPDGSRPADIYARPGAAADGKPRIAILVGGMGLDRSATAEAIRNLPGAITLGFAPYGDDLEAQVRQAREAGHEVTLLLPMEDFAKADASLSHMLLAHAAGNKDRLDWLMSRFTGYAGVGNYLGGRLLGEPGALQPLLEDIGGRGLYFVDDGKTARSLAPALGAKVGLPVIRADVVIDAKPDAASIVEALGRLETLARDHGFALGTATGLPATNVLIARLAASYAARGIMLVPVSQGMEQPSRPSARNDAAPSRTR